MKSKTEHLWFNTSKRWDILDITDQVERVVNESQVQEGLCLVNAMHISASIFINDSEPGLYEDQLEWVEKLAPYGPDYKHHRTGEDNGDSHLKRNLMGRQVVVAITAGKMDFGPWERIHYGEWDGQRKKRVMVKVIGE